LIGLVLMNGTPFGVLFMPFAFVPFFIVEEDTPLFVAFRKSWRATKHSVGSVWLFHFALGPFGLLALSSQVGVIIVTPLYMLGMGYAYIRATGRNDLEWFPPEFGSRSIRSFLRVTLAVLGAVFALFVVWVKSLPTLRGSAWSIQDTMIRASAILSGVGV